MCSYADVRLCLCVYAYVFVCLVFLFVRVGVGSVVPFASLFSVCVWLCSCLTVVAGSFEELVLDEKQCVLLNVWAPNCTEAKLSVINARKVGVR